MLHRPERLRRRGFSLVELLVVILIVTVVISIIVPALGHARTAAKTHATRQLLDTVSQAVGSYELSERESPGVFRPTEMGSAASLNGGLSVMQNMVLAMSGGWQDAASAGATYTISVNPTNVSAKEIKVDPALIGVGKGYFNPPQKNFRKQDGSEGGTKADPATGNQLNNGIEQIPELVDHFGVPIMAWASDPLARQPVAQLSDFARADSGGAGNATLSRYYARANDCLLRCDRVGPKAINQRTQSLIGYQLASRTTNLAGFLGNPSSPIDVTVALNAILPSAPRAAVVLHAAGPNGQYLGLREKGGALAAAANTSADPRLFYGLSFLNLPLPGSPRVDATGRRTSIDLAAEFDDILTTAGSTTN